MPKPQPKPQPKPAPARTDPVVVIYRVEANPRVETEEIDRDQWNAWTPQQRKEHVEDCATEAVNTAGGWGWHIEDAADLAMVGGAVQHVPLDTLRQRLAERIDVTARRAGELALDLQRIANRVATGDLTALDTYADLAGRAQQTLATYLFNSGIEEMTRLAADVDVARNR